MNKRNKIKNKLFIIIMLLLILLILILSYILLNSNVRAKNKLEEILVSDEMDDNLILPKGLYKLIEVYDGVFTTENIAKKYNDFATNIIPRYYKNCKNLSPDELNSFFNKNKNLIFMELRYKDYNDFKDFIEKVKELNGDLLEFESYEILIDSVEKVSGGTNAYISIKYKDNNPIIFNSYVFAKYSEETTPILLTVDVDMNSLEEKVRAREEQEAEEQNTIEDWQEVPKSGKVY